MKGGISFLKTSRVWFIKNGTSSNFNDLVTIIGIIISELVDLGVITYYRRLVSPFSFPLWNFLFQILEHFCSTLIEIECVYFNPTN